MKEAIQISPLPPDRTSMRYAALREAGVELIQNLARETWTDHNVHDPGITLLEAFSYAMTEMGFRIQLDIADLLRSGEQYAPPNLVPLRRVLPSLPVSQNDLRKALLDHHLVGDASVTADVESELVLYENAVGPDEPLGVPPFVETAPNGGVRLRPRGLFEVLLEFENLDLNSNTYTTDITTADGTFTLDFALPHWDEEGAPPLREAPIIDAVIMLDPGGVWRALEEAQTFFGEIRVDYSGSAGPDSVELWVILRITNADQPASVITGILAAAETEVETLGSNTLIDRYVANVSGAFRAVQRVERYLAGWRNLCEDPVRLAAARVQEMAIRARVEVTGSTDLENLLAEIFFAIDCAISPPVLFASLDDFKSLGQTAEEIFEGPLLRHGFLQYADEKGFAGATRIFVSDVLRLIMRLRNESGTDLVAQENPTGRDIIAVTDLTLSNFINNRPITVDVQDCIRLVATDRYRPRLSIAKSRIVFVRDDVEVNYDAARVAGLFTEMQAKKRRTTAPDDSLPTWPAPVGEMLPVEDYYPFQNDLPRVYGLGEAGLPKSAGPERRARALQAKGYLLLFEQFLGDLTAQLAHINCFFSAEPNEQATYFVQPLFQIPGVQKLIKQFPAGGDWESFIQSASNPYRQALQAAAEDEDRFLDRRNRMFDHLLARFGEETVALGQELHRWARRQLTDSISDPALLQQKIGQRRRDVNQRLLHAKSAYLHDVPELNRSRLQAFGDPVQRKPGILSVRQSDAGDYSWLLTLDGDELLQSADPLPSAAAAFIAGSDAALLAAQPAFYTVVTDAGMRRYELRDGADSVGRSLQTWPTVAAAQTALQETAARFAQTRMDLSLTPMEQRVANLTGIRSSLRRRLIVPPGDFFEIHDAPDADPLIEKRWRLWEAPGFGGGVMLSSVSDFEAPIEADAIDLAQQSIDLALRDALDEWNYRVQPSGSGTFSFDLVDPNDNQLALRAAPMPTVADVEQAIRQTVDHVYHLYSGEGFHLVEHLLLRPKQAGDPVLSIPISDIDTERDPYSQRLSVFFPSGYGRDFTLDPLTAAREEVPPHRFRDREFRRHAERMIRQACPAHLLPGVYWVDRQLPGTGDDPASFDRFEMRYFEWLETILIPGATPAAVTSARVNLVQSVNAIVNG